MVTSSPRASYAVTPPEPLAAITGIKKLTKPYARVPPESPIDERRMRFMRLLFSISGTKSPSPGEGRVFAPAIITVSGTLGLESLTDPQPGYKFLELLELICGPD
jgi:hypothetical protein